MLSNKLKDNVCALLPSLVIKFTRTELEEGWTCCPSAVIVINSIMVCWIGRLFSLHVRKQWDNQNSLNEEEQGLWLGNLPHLFQHLHPPQTGEGPVSPVATPYWKHREKITSDLDLQTYKLPSAKKARLVMRNRKKNSAERLPGWAL